MLSLEGKKIGLAMTGSHCTLDQVLEQVEAIARLKAEIYPVFSPAMQQSDTRFGPAEDFRQRVIAITGRMPVTTIVEAEPFGPGRTLDILLIAPCTGNTMAKLANGIVDTAVLMAAKAQLRNGRPVVLSIATNDGLGLNARNLATMLITRNVYFVPFSQDNPVEKPNSLVSKAGLIIPTLLEALQGRQIQPVLAVPEMTT